jgi:hypothetical protein
MKLRDITEIPTTVAELFEKHPEIWTKGRGSQGLFTYDGHPVDTFAEADQCCLGSAIGFIARQGGLYDGKIHGMQIEEMSKAVLRVINARYRRTCPYLFITTWNDEQGRKVEDVIAIAKEARI